MQQQYVLITPAKNESKYLRFACDSVLAQCIHPLKWVIIDDGSSDTTAEIANEYSQKCSFITVIRKTPKPNRSFASKANAFNEAYKNIKSLPFNYIGNLDADISLPSNYYQTILEHFHENVQLGVAGGVVIENIKGVKKMSQSGSNHVAGAFQMFRRECFEKIGGYKPVRTGGMDSVALISARMYGWRTQMFRDLEVTHHRPAARDFNTAIRVSFLQGKTDSNLGVTVLFSLIKFIKRIPEHPIIFSSLVRLIGYISYSISCVQRDVDEKIVMFYRQEQAARMQLKSKKIAK
jgi:biofilm PGA synthesis N-glycosyltransferase PgaC